jgi:hypothetical protein
MAGKSYLYICSKYYVNLLAIPLGFSFLHLTDVQTTVNTSMHVVRKGNNKFRKVEKIFGNRSVCIWSKKWNFIDGNYVQTKSVLKIHDTYS